MIFAADYETTVNPLDCRVWAWGLCEVGNTDHFRYGNSIETLFSFCENHNQKITLYFHNLKFDGEFIFNWLFRQGYVHVKDRKELKTKSFSTLISDRGVFYSCEICFKHTEDEFKTVKIYDSLKLLPFSVEEIAQAFSLPISKLAIDYNKYREPGHELDEQEIAYLKGDVTIVAMALQSLFEQNLKKMTTGANALNDYKIIFGKKRFEKLYPTPEYDKLIRKSYKGGFTYLNPKFAGKKIAQGIVLDVNSLYPSVMYYEKMPYGEGILYQGFYQEDELYDLYIQNFRCQFELKDGMIPTIQIKNTLSFVPNEYLTSSNGEYVELWLTSVDLKLFLEHYDVYDIEWIQGFKYKSSTILFKDYIDKWNAIKVQATKDHNKPLRTIAKLMLNSLYGKFASAPEGRSKYPYLGEDGIVHYTVGELEARKAVYIPIGTFITSWARNKTIRSAQTVYDRFVYADTDSLHLVGNEVPEGLEIDDTKLGAWKLESHFDRAKFLRQKCYIEDIISDDEEIYNHLSKTPELSHHVDLDRHTILKITCAGMPKGCYKNVTFDNFEIGASYDGKLKPTHVPGGLVLTNIPHTLRGT